MTLEEMRVLGWDSADVIIVTGDAYVDHPAFGTAVIGRVLEKAGYRVAILAQPDWNNPDAIKAFGRPRLFFGVTAGNVDSMLARYTAFKKVRNNDAYSPGGRGGLRPGRATLIYCNLIRSAFKGVPIVIGGIEASMRRLAHYDFWDNKVRRSIILDSRSDLLVYGMGETQIVEAARFLERGQSISGMPGTVEVARAVPPDAVMLPAEEDVMDDKARFLEMYRLVYKNQHRLLAQPSGGRFIIQNPPVEQSREELDDIYNLPFTRDPHLFYSDTLIPAFEMIKCSVTAHRGCVSGCSFCSLGLHQGRRIVSRSAKSIYQEIGEIALKNYFHGHISDIGGPSADMYGYDCLKGWRCGRESCLYPNLCGNLVSGVTEWLSVLGGARQIYGVKHVTVGSGVRFDLLLLKGGQSALNELARNYIGGQIKIAPEHTSLCVLRAMRKTPCAGLEDFNDAFQRAAKKAGRELYIIPYLMSCHPGCDGREMKEMNEKVLSIFGFIPDQIQAFIPLPMTLSSVIYWTGCDPLSREEYFIERDPLRRRRQHDIFFKGKE
jgi:uncharacterized radical SAM protein YgiQ